MQGGGDGEVGRKEKTKPLALEQQGALEQSLTAAYFPT